jgi:hypothetical protein
VIVGGLCDEFVDYVIVGGLCDEYYMSVTNIIYACDDICDLCEYLRLLEKKKKKKNSSSRAKSNALGEGGAPRSAGYRPSPRAECVALGEEPIFNESQISGSRRRSGPHS